MKYYALTKEEEKILKDYEAGDFVSEKQKGVKSNYQQYANATLSKTKQINVRVSEKDLLKLKAHAVGKGIPYQTLVSSILHQFGNS